MCRILPACNLQKDGNPDGWDGAIVGSFFGIFMASELVGEELSLAKCRMVWTYDIQ